MEMALPPHPPATAAAPRLTAEARRSFERTGVLVLGPVSSIATPEQRATARRRVLAAQQQHPEPARRAEPAALAPPRAAGRRRRSTALTSAERRIVWQQRTLLVLAAAGNGLALSATTQLKLGLVGGNAGRLATSTVKAPPHPHSPTYHHTATRRVHTLHPSPHRLNDTAPLGDRRGSSWHSSASATFCSAPSSPAPAIGSAAGRSCACPCWAGSGGAHRHCDRLRSRLPQR